MFEWHTALQNKVISVGPIRCLGTTQPVSKHEVGSSCLAQKRVSLLLTKTANGKGSVCTVPFPLTRAGIGGT